MKHKSKLVPVCIATFAFCAMTASASAAEETENSVGVPPKATASEVTNASERTVPFRGTISATDERAKTFTIAGKEKSRVFKITDKTVLTKAGVTATMKDVIVNEEVRGSYWKAADGTLEARMVKLGPKTEAEKGSTKKQARRKTANSGLPVSSNSSASAKP